MNEDFENTSTQSANTEDLRYILYVAHDITIANVLKFLGYYETHGYKKKPILFASSLRIELLKETNKSFK